MPRTAAWTISSTLKIPEEREEIIYDERYGGLFAGDEMEIKEAVAGLAASQVM